MSSSPLSIFILGATGYLGSEFLFLLARDYPTYPINALVRNATPGKVERLQEIHPNLTVIEGTLEDADTIVGQILKADIVINTASSDHWPSVKGKCGAHLIDLAWESFYSYSTRSNLGRLGEELGKQTRKPSPLHPCFWLRYHQ